MGLACVGSVSGSAVLAPVSHALFVRAAVFVTLSSAATRRPAELCYRCAAVGAAGCGAAGCGAAGSGAGSGGRRCRLGSKSESEGEGQGRRRPEMQSAGWQAADYGQDDEAGVAGEEERHRENHQVKIGSDAMQVFGNGDAAQTTEDLG